MVSIRQLKQQQLSTTVEKRNNATETSDRVQIVKCTGGAIIDDGTPNENKELATEVKNGLRSDRNPKTLPCRFFYDEEGSILFEEICELPEYYPTRSEHEIILKQASRIATNFCGPDTVMIELGSGSSAKTRTLIERFLAVHGKLHYVPIDISDTMLESSAKDLIQKFDRLRITGIAAEYVQGLGCIRDLLFPRQSKLILWLGSSVGNFTRSDAASFLKLVRECMTCPEDRLLIGIDLRKDKDVLERAYDDAQGVTAQFNLNLLKRINRELGANFDLDKFEHRSVYDEKEGRIEMHLVSKVEQTVRIPDSVNGFYEVSFEAGEYIHTENSYKYSLKEIDELARASGFRVAEQWFDSERRFSLNIFEPVQVEVAATAAAAAAALSVATIKPRSPSRSHRSSTSNAATTGLP